MKNEMFEELLESVKEAKAIKNNQKIKVADWKVNDTINKMIAEKDLRLEDFGLKND